MASVGYRDTQLTCFCGRPLADGSRAKFEYSQCPGCDGIWVSADELPKLLATISPLNAYDAASTESGISERACLVCNEKMLELGIGKTVADCCEHHGYWFDQGELGDVLRFHREYNSEPEPAEKVGPMRRLRPFLIAGASIGTGVLAATLVFVMWSETPRPPDDAPLSFHHESEILATSFEFPKRNWTTIPRERLDLAATFGSHQSFFRALDNDDTILMSVGVLRTHEFAGVTKGQVAQSIEAVVRSSAAATGMLCIELRARPVLLRCGGHSGSEYDDPDRSYRLAFPDYALFADIFGPPESVSRFGGEMDAIMLSAKPTR